MEAPTLLIMAAGMGTRYQKEGGALKQLDTVHNDHHIWEYAVYDAVKVGYKKIVFVIRKDFAEAFQSTIGKKIEQGIKPYGATVDYAYQSSVQEIQEQYPNRQKMWGTGHAVLCAKDVINEPFVVINADDYYGSDTFSTLADFFKNNAERSTYALPGFQVSNVLSPHGTVSRGLCDVDASGYLKSIVERTKVGYANDNTIVYYENEESTPVDPNTLVSMNTWAFYPEVFPVLEKEFAAFAQENGSEPKKEFFIALPVMHMINQGLAKLKVLPTDATWFGMTYPGDKIRVSEELNRCCQEGIYPDNLWAN